MIKLILLASLFFHGIGAQSVPYARSLGLSDADLLKHSPIVPGRKIRVRAQGVLQDEVDDYNDFEEEALANGKGAKANHGLRQVTYKPIPQEYNIPSLDVEEKSLGPSSSLSSSRNGAIPTLSPVPQKTAQQRNVAQGVPLRQGYFFQHYPWDRLPHRYLIRPGFQYVYPTQYQATQYFYPGALPYKDPYNIYASANGCGGGCGGGQGCGGGCGGQSAGGCGGSGGCGGDCVDCDGSYEDSGEYSDESTSSEEVSSGRSGEAHLINKKDPLDDLDLEDLERIDKAGSAEI